MFHFVPSSVPLSQCLSRASMHSSAQQARCVNPLHTCTCGGIKFPWADLAL